MPAQETDLIVKTIDLIDISARAGWGSEAARRAHFIGKEKRQELKRLFLDLRTISMSWTNDGASGEKVIVPKQEINRIHLLAQAIKAKAADMPAMGKDSKIRIYQIANEIAASCCRYTQMRLFQ